MEREAVEDSRPQNQTDAAFTLRSTTYQCMYDLEQTLNSLILSFIICKMEIIATLPISRRVATKILVITWGREFWDEEG